MSSSATKLARVPEYFSSTQIETLRATVCPGLDNEEMSLFSEVCASTGLNPFARQIYALKRRQWDSVRREMVEKMSIQTGIDGYRLIAERTGKYKGQAPFQWCGEDGRWVDVWLKSTPPAAAKATVYREGFAVPLERIARYSSYVQTNKDGKATGQWGKADAEMLAKCAEALALRTAFPHELSGVYTAEEMDQAEEKPRHVTASARVVDMPRASEPKQLPAADVPKFSLKWSAQWGGKPLSEAPIEVVGQYKTDLEAALAKAVKPTQRETIERSLHQLQDEFTARMEEEARKAGEPAATPETDGSWVAGDAEQEDVL
jgi:phage recombination protein Bet